MRPDRRSSIFTPVPIRWFFLATAGALGLGSLTILWPAAGLITLAICISLAVIIWTSRRSDPFVSALALVIFWLPFYTTVSRLGISPQEVAVYGIWVFGAMLSPLGIRRWLLGVITSLSTLAQLIFLLFTLACFQAALRVPHPDLITTSINLRMTVFYPLLLALLVAYAVRTRHCIRLLLWAFVAGGVCFATYALGLRLWGVDIANGAVAGRLGAEASFLTGYHPNNLGLYLTLALSFMPALFRQAWHASQARVLKLVAVVAGTGIMSLALWLAYSRGALLALLLGLALLLVVRVSMSGTRQRLISIGLVGLGIIAFGIFIAWKGVDSLGRYADLLNTGALSNDPNVQFREQLYTRAITLATQHLFTGTGLGTFAQGANVPFSPHNTYLDLWVSTGIFGVLAFTAAMLLGAFAALRAARRFQAQQRSTYVLSLLSVASALIAFLAQAFVETFDQQPRIAPTVWMLVGLAQATLLALSAKRKAGSEARASGESEPKQAAGEGRLKRPPRRWEMEGEDEAKAIADQPTVALPAQRVFDGLEHDLLSNSGNPWQIEMPPTPADPQQGSQAHQTSTTASPHTERPPHQTERASTSKGQQARAETLMQRAPASYLWNQIYALWFFAANFLLSIILTRGLSKQEYGIYAVLSTILSTILFICALGLEDTATIFVPRVLARDGQSSAGRLMIRLITIRMLVIGGVGIILSASFSAALPLLNAVGLSLPLLNDSSKHSGGITVILMAVYLVGTGLVTLENALFAALLKSRITLIIGGGGQALNLLATAALLYAGYGTNGVFAALGIAAWLTGGAYLFALGPLLRHQSKQKIKDTREMRKLAINAWLVNVTNSALGKQMDIVLMTAFSISYASIGYYNLAYQLSNVVGLLLISGLGGVGVAAMSAARAAGGRKRLASIWRASLMLQILFAVPLQMLCLVRADQVVTLLYGALYAGAIPLFRVFLAFAILGRLVGGGANQSVLYVVGRQRTVLVVRWAGFILNAALDIALIPRYGPAGPLIGTGFSQTWVGLVEYLLMRKELPTSYPSEFTLRVIGASVVPAILLLWWNPSGLIGLAGSVTIFTIVLIIGLLTLRAGQTGDLEALLKVNPRLQNLIAIFARHLPPWLSGSRLLSPLPVPDTR